MTFTRSALQIIRKLIDRAGYNIYPKVDHFISDQVDLMVGAENHTIFDVGANHGKFARIYRDMFPDARLFCFEPIPHVAEVLRRRVNNIEVIEIALGRDDGKSEFYVNEFEDTSSLLRSDLTGIPESYRRIMKPKHSIKVTTARLDTLMERFGLERIDILKMDIQGGEYGALEGAQNTLASGKIILIALEVFFEKYYTDQALFGDIAYLLSQHGYRLHRLYNINFSGTNGRPQWADAIFVAPGSDNCFSPTA